MAKCFAEKHLRYLAPFFWAFLHKDYEQMGAWFNFKKCENYLHVIRKFGNS